MTQTKVQEVQEMRDTTYCFRRNSCLEVGPLSKPAELDKRLGWGLGSQKSGLTFSSSD